MPADATKEVLSHKSIRPGKLVSLRRRDWMVLPSASEDILILKPLGGSDDEITGIYLPLGIESDQPQETSFPKPSTDDIGDIATARLLYDSARLAFRNGAGPFRALAKLSFRPRSYQMVPLIMALRLAQERIRLLIADDVGVGKTIEALLITRELLERRKIKRFAVVCLPHLCEQWQAEIRDKLDIDAVIIRSNTQASLDRQIQGDTSVYDYYPYQVISIDFIKSDNRRNVFIKECPELVIVDEAHTCARPAGVSRTQQQRYHLVSDLAEKDSQNLILLTATPHSGQPEQFHSLLGMLDPSFEDMDIPSSTDNQRKKLARHFIQRKRADVERWMNEDTPFPERDSFEWAYDLSPSYQVFFENILSFARQLIATDDNGSADHKRVHYWTALALLRGVMSSPAAGIEMLQNRLNNISVVSEKDTTNEMSLGEFENEELNPVADSEFGYESDTEPTALTGRLNWSDSQKRLLRSLGAEVQKLANPKDDQKLAAAEAIIDDWMSRGFHVVVFCRYIATAKYLGEQLSLLLHKRNKKTNIQVVTSELPDERRKQIIEEMGSVPDRPRVLIATDCLSEGINLQQHFTAVLHYDLPWNPNRLEQREGRIDRFGQLAPKVTTCLLYGGDNPIDGIVLDVLLRKVKEIKRSTGINVPFPEDSQSIIDAIAHALLINPNRQINVNKEDRNQYKFDFGDLDEAKEKKAEVSHKIEEAAEREKTSRSIFAQNAIKAHEIEEDLKAVDEAIGDPNDVRDFVVNTLQNILGVQITPDKQGRGYRINLANLSAPLKALLPSNPKSNLFDVSFESPTKEGFYYIGRNHRFVEQLCQLVMATTLSRKDKHAARAAIIRTKQVSTKTTILLFRCRNVIESPKDKHQVVAEEMVLWGWQGTPSQKEFIGHTAAKDLLLNARASSDMSQETRINFLNNELRVLDDLKEEFDKVAKQQSQKLVDSHERFSALMDAKRFQVAYPVLPMDLLGTYILLPE